VARQSVIAVRRRSLSRRVKSGVAFVQGRAVSPAAHAHPRLQRWVAETMAAHQPSEAFVSGSGMAPYLDPYQFSRRTIDMIALGSERWRRTAETSGWPKSELYWRQERVLLAHERQVAARFDETLFASAAEANLFLRRAPRAPTRVVALRNGIDQDFFDPARDYPNPYRAGRRSVVFAGALDYVPTIEAATWFATEVMTMLRHRVPTLDFWIAGARPSRAIRALARRDIHVMRDPADIRPFLAHADAVLAPLRVARGIENTVLEGMAMGKPVVATPAALDGFDFVVGEEVFCSASAPGFASGVVAALGEKGRAAGERAQRRIDADYGWAAALHRLDAALKEERPVVAAVS
jgi:sugar transferase (PEP-CTERM/EpsH1 system associated)